MTSYRRAAAALVAVAASGLVVAACGSSGGSNGGGAEDSKSADQIIKDAKAALKSATSYRIAGSVDNNGDRIDLDVKVQGSDTFAGHLGEQGVAFDFVATGGKLYLRGQSLFAKYAPAVADTIGNNWVATSSNDPRFSSAVSALGGFADPSGFADSLGSSGGPFTKDGTTTVNGQAAVVIKSSDGTLDVADSSPAYPLKLDGGSKGTLTLSGYGSDFGITAPSGAVDISSSGGGSSSDTGGNSTSTDTSSSSS